MEQDRQRISYEGLRSICEDMIDKKKASLKRKEAKLREFGGE